MDDTQAVALGAASLQATVPATEEWMQVTWQDVCVDEPYSWVQGEQGVMLWGISIPMAASFRRLGIDVAIGGSGVT